ncbi:DUF4178 domain-containing protein [Sphingobium sp. CAP-1]|uniref:DUF4178 domain-containing protein n=1 Tax=Sphingobium sp. CAP-1 TaxID=2676077 RepID=UPI0012BB3824|nr:DUF4178 domain-containing protein [Sphingobium sp. CAP-1]QGP80373.1 DUF4178 domain-containing protein [Sphingobium sp. CAP-1]
MQSVACPTCGAEVSFRSPALPVRVCDYCRTLVVRYSQSAQAMGEAAVLPFDISPIQIGTEGHCFDQSFQIIGRVRWGWTDGAWNEWLMLLADGSHAWLGEAMGQFMALREVELGGSQARVLRRLMNGTNVLPGESGTIAGHNYEVADIRTIHCLGCEGELPFTAPSGWEALSVDFRNADGRCASFQKDAHGPTLYVGHYVTLTALEPRHLRPLPGWSLPVYAG